jgi:hypothetical protein
MTGPSRFFRLVAATHGLLVGSPCYALFFACFLYAIAFIGDFALVPEDDRLGRTGPLGLALAVNLGLLSLFAIQHSVMARPAFKRAWTKIVPEAAERPTYVLASTLALALLFACWQPIGSTVWAVTTPPRARAARALLRRLDPPALRDCADRSTSTCSACARRGSASAADRTRTARSRRRACTRTSAIRSTCRGRSSSGRRR